MTTSALFVVDSIGLRAGTAAWEASLTTWRLLISNRRYCAREDAISCEDSERLTFSVTPVVVRNDLTDWRFEEQT